ncbi:hypothetical protein M201_gp21 [Haloarcula californiae tailed virus 2]|uniref:Uncharacterized protein n=1 Tax=Haloarcula californiae tailed virus 2 TaxID=1273747 RepID=R4TA30_9CAUD|nr:hypothetical protein M201_gp21 [Haloarcula californiae tailed virus 2]AGM11795.1 hypothetical protein HCTV2_21 [Haloarcula californiae tailed virus 2]
MELDWANDIDTACTSCGEDAVDWVQVRDGTRRYACESCLEELLRFDTYDSLADVPETPQAVECQGCHTLTLVEDTGAAGVRCAECDPLATEDMMAEMRQAIEDEQGG